MAELLEQPKVITVEWKPSDPKRLFATGHYLSPIVIGRCVIEGRVGAVIGLVCKDDGGTFAVYWAAGPDGGTFVTVEMDIEATKQSRKKTEDTTAGGKGKRRSTHDAD